MEYLAIILAAACVAMVTAAPTSAPDFRQVNVELAQGNRTLCPFKVVVDYEPERIPRRIKKTMCLHPHITKSVKTHHHKQKCEDIKAHEKRGQCVELRDTVLVSYKGAMTTLDVAVGCTCMFQDHTIAVNPENFIE